MRLLIVASALLAFTCTGNALAAPPYVAIEQRLSAEQLHATGLDQLSASQLSLLNQLLRDDQAAVAAESVAAERIRAKQPEAPITSTLKGEFRGWQNGTVFELANGQRWRVVNDDDYYLGHGPTNPKVTVKPGVLSSWRFEIEGIPVSAKVRRVEP